MPSSPRSTIIVVLLTTLWLVMISLTSTAPSDRKYYIWTENIQTMATPNNIYFSNLDLLVSSLSQSTAQSNSFHTATVNRLYGLYLCRGDTTAGVCRDCVATAATDIRKLCPNSSEAIIWYDMCLLRYSNASFFGALESNMNTLMWNLQNNSQPDDPDMDAGALMYGLASDLLASPLMYETKEKELNVTEASYDVGQCSRDLDDANMISSFSTFAVVTFKARGNPKLACNASPFISKLESYTVRPYSLN